MSPAPRGVTARRLIRALEDDGFEFRRTRGSHRVYAHPDGRRVVVSYHHLRDTFPVGTLHGMLRDAGWSDDDLKRLGLL